MTQSATDEPFDSVPRYGLSNPERVHAAIWELAFRNNWTAFKLQKHLGIGLNLGFGHWPGHSSYRERAKGPVWSWERFGRTSTRLLDGSIVHVAGEHEDSYDADFCIYNDVIVEEPDGGLSFCLYPADTFPPTDFHTATLVDGSIILIGSLGYKDLRKPGETQVFRLHTSTLQIEHVLTTVVGVARPITRRARRLARGPSLDAPRS